MFKQIIQKIKSKEGTEHYQEDLFLSLASNTDTHLISLDSETIQHLPGKFW